MTDITESTSESPRRQASLDAVTVVVPVRNAERMLDGCLRSIVRSEPKEVIVVDGRSSDSSREVARVHGARVLSDEGRGLPYARMLGVRAATTRYVALIDADVVLGDGDLGRLLSEFQNGGYAGLQAGLLSTAGPGYWGQALVFHHRTGRSRNWFGVVATILERDLMLQYGFDQSFLSGEDIELRWRLSQAGHRVGVSTRTIVEHRFASDDFAFARAQFLADGAGLGRMVRKQRIRGASLLLLPLAAGARGAAVAFRHRRFGMVGYFAAFTLYNYRGLLHGLRGIPLGLTV